MSEKKQNIDVSENRNRSVQNLKTTNGSKKVVHTWSFEPITQKEQNISLWPFKVIRDKGKSTKLECRSLSALKDSFKNTSYNLNECTQVLSRYSALMRVFKERYSKEISRITHMFITFDSIYFMIENDGVIRGGNYGVLLCGGDKVNNLVNSFDITNKISENMIIQLFDAYKKTGEPNFAQALKGSVDNYIKARKNMLLLDNNKYMTDLFKNSEFTFSSLKYLVFMSTPKNAFDYSSFIYYALQERGVDITPSLYNAISLIPSLKTELQAFLMFADKSNNPQRYLRNIRKIYNLENREVTKEDVKTIFKDCGNINNTEGLLFKANITEKEIEENNRKILELRKQNGEDVVKESKITFVNNMQQIKGIIDNITNLLKRGLEYNSVANAAEKSIWVNNFKINNIRMAIQNEYDYKKVNKSDFKVEDFITVEPYIQLNNSVVQELQEGTSIEDVDLFFEILPTYFKDNRRTVQSMGIGFETSEKAEKTVKDTNRIKKQLFDLFEVFIGIQYGILGVYMKRFGKGERGRDLAVKLMSTIRNPNRPIVYSKNVLDIAERYFYCSLGLSLNKEMENYFDNEQGKSIRSSYESFCKNSIDTINETNTLPLTHSNISGTAEQIKEKINNLFEIYKCLEFIFEQYAVFFKLK